jgi:hypothetical protein
VSWLNLFAKTDRSFSRVMRLGDLNVLIDQALKLPTNQEWFIQDDQGTVRAHCMVLDTYAHRRDQSHDDRSSIVWGRRGGHSRVLNR